MTLAIKQTDRKILTTIAIMVGLMILLGALASAAGLAYEDKVDQIRSSLSGPIAAAFGVVAIVTAGALWAFQGDQMSGGLKGIVGIAFVVGIALSANSLVSFFGGSSSGALL